MAINASPAVVPTIDEVVLDAYKKAGLLPIEYGIGADSQWVVKASHGRRALNRLLASKSTARYFEYFVNLDVLELAVGVHKYVLDADILNIIDDGSYIPPLAYPLERVAHVEETPNPGTGSIALVVAEGGTISIFVSALATGGGSIPSRVVTEALSLRMVWDDTELIGIIGTVTENAGYYTIVLSSYESTGDDGFGTSGPMSLYFTPSDEQSQGETPVKPMSGFRWNQLSAKGSRGTPVHYFIERNNQNAAGSLILRLWPVPSEAGQIRFRTHRIPGSSGVGADNPDFKRHWEQWAVLALAYELMTDSGFPLAERQLIRADRDVAFEELKSYDTNNTPPDVVFAHTTPWTGRFC
jgi:hypothetical protein